jgi:hypothetical protein
MRILGDVTDLLITTFNPNLGKGPGLAKNYLHVEIRGIYSSIVPWIWIGRRLGG